MDGLDLILLRIARRDVRVRFVRRRLAWSTTVETTGDWGTRGCLEQEQNNAFETLVAST